MADFDRLARIYRWLEYFTFGPLLSRCRLQYLDRLSGARNVLALGDGDGRFLEQFLRVNQTASVDVVDSSSAMLRILSRRASRVPKIDGRSEEAESRVTLHCSDALLFTAPATGRRYDLVVTHFFLDCFSTADLQLLLRRIRPHLRNGAFWLVSEFAIPPATPQTWAMMPRLASLLIGGLYRCFGLLTGLKVRNLPAYEAVFVDAGFTLIERRTRLAGILKSELWNISSRL